MTWTYSGDPTNSELDELRFTVQDTDSTVPLLTDEELTYLLNRWRPVFGSVLWTASVAASAISRKFAGVVSVSADGVTANVADLSKRYADLAAQLRWEYTKSMTAGELDLANLMAGAELDGGIRPLTFGVGMHDNPEAGQQDYAGTDVIVLFDDLVERER